MVTRPAKQSEFRATQRYLPGSFPVLNNTALTLPVLGLVQGGIPTIAARAIADDSLAIFLDHVLEKKFKRCRNVGITA